MSIHKQTPYFIHRPFMIPVKSVYALIFIALLTVSPLANAVDDRINMFVGEVRVLKIGDIDRVAVGNGKLLSTSILKNGQLVLLAEEAGDTALHIWGKQGWEKDIRISIGSSDSGRTVSEIQQLLSSIDGVTVREVGGRAVVEGTVSEDKLVMLETIQKIYPDIIMLAQKTKLKQDKMIYMKVQITEFSTNLLDDLGIDWSDSHPINGPAWAFSKDYRANDSFRVTPGLPTFTQDTSSGIVGALPVNSTATRGYFGIATEITSRLNFLVDSGDALILASPRLSARSGGEAEFLAGGEIPLPTVDANGQTNVEFKDVGIKLVIKPVADDIGNITARVETEVSTVDDAVEVRDIPGFLTRRTNTDISMKQGETLVLSGLVNNEIGKDVKQIKGLGSIPIIGWLFRSEGFRNKQTDLVIFVTPSIIDTDSDVNKKEIARHSRMITRFEKIIEDDIIDTDILQQEVPEDKAVE